MSLDVTLKSNTPTKKTCEHCGSECEVYEHLFEANITHNLNTMADKAGIYEYIWRPENLNIIEARQLIEPLTKGLADMKARPEYYQQFNASNGWGLYEHFIPWIENYLNACIEHPDAEILISR